MRYFLYVFISVFIFYFLFQNFLSFSFTRKQKLAFLTLLCAIHFILIPFLSQSYILLLLTGVSLFIYRLSPNPVTDLFCVFLGYFYNVSLNAVLLTLYTFFAGTSIYQKQYSLLFPTIHLIVSACTSYFLGHVLHRHLKIRQLIISKHLSVPLCINLLLCIILCIFNIIWGEKISYNPQNILFNTIIFLTYFVVTNILLFRLNSHVQKEEREKYLEEKYHLLSLYTKELEDTYESTRKIKHDYDNILLSISEYLKQNKYDELFTYYQTEILPFTNQNHNINLYLSELSYIRIPEVKSLLIAKIVEAKAQKLCVHLEVKNSCSFLPVPVLDVIRILGIFLDNALEAACESSEKNLDIAIIQDEDVLTFIISNSTLPLSVPIWKLNEKNYSSKGYGRGIGLSTAAEIIDKYSSLSWTTKYQDNTFIQIIEMEANANDSHIHM